MGNGGTTGIVSIQASLSDFYKFPIVAPASALIELCKFVRRKERVLFYRFPENHSIIWARSRTGCHFMISLGYGAPRAEFPSSFFILRFLPVVLASALIEL
jgi:hypothetical protein